MKQTLFYLILITISYNLTAQDGSVKELQSASNKEVKSLDSLGWKKGGTLLINLNQGSLSNWAAGGEQNTFGINGLLSYAVQYKAERYTWDNYFEIALGFQNATSFNKFRKIDDRIDITSKYGRKIGNSKWSYGILANLFTQAIPGYNYNQTPEVKISNLFSPGKILLSPGFNYQPNDKFSFFISPATARLLLKTDPDFLNQNLFGVAAGEKSYMELGAFATARYSTPLAKWATYTGRVDLFSNYRRNPQNVDLLMTNLLTLKFSKALATNISVDIIYDDDVIQKTQLKQILGVGLTVSL